MKKIKSKIIVLPRSSTSEFLSKHMIWDLRNICIPLFTIAKMWKEPNDLAIIAEFKNV